MALAETKATERGGSPVAPTARIEVSDFGPIESASVDLRPLTVFVGPSNSGKTYLATLLYALSRSFGGFPRYPDTPGVSVPTSASTRLDSPSEEDWVSLAESLAIRGRAIRLNDFPSIFRERAESKLNRVVTGEEGLRFEIKRCFDIDSLSDVVRWSASGTDARISVSIDEGDQCLWSFKMGIGSTSEIISKESQPGVVMVETPRYLSKVTSQCKLEDPEFILPRGADFQSDFFATLLNSDSKRKIVNEIYPRARNILKYNSIPRGTFYMPAARSGIMQSHRVIASSLLARATRAGLDRFPALPTFSGMIADFMEHLILYDGPSEGYSKLHSADRPARMWRRQSQSGEVNIAEEMANEVEQGLLGGRIRNRGVSSRQYPDFVYVSNESNKPIGMSRSSSMVSELAPLVLFLRQNVFPQDMLIIEEPEAHLHPAAQAQMATVLAKLARAGVRVVVTTHSDWLLKQIGNLIRKGELETAMGSNHDEAEHSSSLPIEDVGVWLFQKNDSNGGSTIREIPYDRSDGVEPTEFADVDEELYNRSAGLQNLLDDQEQGDSL